VAVVEDDGNRRSVTNARIRAYWPRGHPFATGVTFPYYLGNFRRNEKTFRTSAHIVVQNGRTTTVFVRSGARADNGTRKGKCTLTKPRGFKGTVALTRNSPNRYRAFWPVYVTKIAPGNWRDRRGEGRGVP